MNDPPPTRSAFVVGMETTPVADARSLVTLSPKQELAVRFVDQARLALRDGKAIEVSTASVMTVLADLPARRHLLTLFRAGDKALVEAATDLFTEMAKREERGARADDRAVDLIDRTCLAPAVSVSAGGLALFFSLGATLGPVGMFCGGVAGMVFSGWARHVKKRSGDQRREDAAGIREFVGDLRKVGEAMQ